MLRISTSLQFCRLVNGFSATSPDIWTDIILSPYFCTFRKLRKRQEIYNVNPKVLRSFEEYEENGTSGRADVPLETEQY